MSLVLPITLCHALDARVRQHAGDLPLAVTSRYHALLSYWKEKMRMCWTSVSMIGVGAGVLAGCATPQMSTPAPVTHLEAPFDEAAARQALEPGSASLEGNAFLRQQGGGVVTCAGSTVSLLPVTAYAKERVDHIYGKPDVSRGYVPAAYATRRFEPDVPAYQELRKSTLCDSQGKFQFNGIKPGDFYVITAVLWRVGDKPQGGALAARVHVTASGNEPLILTSN